jgi:hypothetical protein
LLQIGLAELDEAPARRHLTKQTLWYGFKRQFLAKIACREACPFRHRLRESEKLVPARWGHTGEELGGMRWIGGDLEIPRWRK